MDLVTTAQLLGNFGEFFGAIAVVATLIFVGIQVRQSAAASRLSGTQAAMHSWISVTLSLVANEPLRRAQYNGIYPGLTKLADDDDDMAITGFFLQAGIKAVESNYLQWQGGNLSDELWHGYQATLREAFVINKYWNVYWERSRLNYSPDFRRFADEIREEAAHERARMLEGGA